MKRLITYILLVASLSIGCNHPAQLNSINENQTVSNNNISVEENDSNDADDDFESTRHDEKSEIASSDENGINTYSDEDDKNHKDEEYELKWHYVFYSGQDEDYLDVPFTDVSLMIEHNGNVDRLELGTFIGFSTESHLNTISHLDPKVIITGWSTYYSGGGVLVYVIQKDDYLLVMQHVLEENVENENDYLEDTEIASFKLPLNCRITTNSGIKETILPLFEKGSETKISKSNWLNNDYIKEVRDVFRNIQAEIGNGKLVERSKQIIPEENNKLYSKTIFIDESDNVRKYVEMFGSEDSVLTFEYYYDLNNIMRFIFVSGGAVNGTYLEHRVYFDEEGNKFWEVQKIEGEGYPFLDEITEEYYKLKPLEAYENK